MDLGIIKVCSTYSFFFFQKFHSSNVKCSWQTTWVGVAHFWRRRLQNFGVWLVAFDRQHPHLTFYQRTAWLPYFDNVNVIIFCMFPSFSSESIFDKRGVSSIACICFRSTTGGRPPRKPLGRFYHPVDIYLLFKTTGKNATNIVSEQVWSIKAQAETRHQSEPIPSELRWPTKRSDDSCKM